MRRRGRAPPRGTTRGWLRNQQRDAARGDRPADAEQRHRRRCSRAARDLRVERRLRDDVPGGHPVAQALAPSRRSCRGCSSRRGSAAPRRAPATPHRPGRPTASRPTSGEPSCGGEIGSCNARFSTAGRPASRLSKRVSVRKPALRATSWCAPGKSQRLASPGATNSGAPSSVTSAPGSAQVTFSSAAGRAAASDK